MSSQGIQEQFLGRDESDTTQELRYAKSVNEMYVFVHNHVLSLSLVFLALGGILYFSSIVSERVKRFLILEPLLAVITTFGGIALVRFVSPSFSWLVLISGVSLFVSYVVIVFLIIKELWFSEKNSLEGKA
jgi:predicted tellurium resistance membrane protein TerC